MAPTGQKRANRLAEVRIAAGLTQEQLARRADISVFTISRLERDENEPGLRTAQVVAAALGLSINTIWPELEVAS